MERVCVCLCLSECVYEGGFEAGVRKRGGCGKKQGANKFCSYSHFRPNDFIKTQPTDIQHQISQKKASEPSVTSIPIPTTTDCFPLPVSQTSISFESISMSSETASVISDGCHSDFDNNSVSNRPVAQSRGVFDVIRSRRLQNDRNSAGNFVQSRSRSRAGSSFGIGSEYDSPRSMNEFENDLNNNRNKFTPSEESFQFEIATQVPKRSENFQSHQENEQSSSCQDALAFPALYQQANIISDEVYQTSRRNPNVMFQSTPFNIPNYSGVHQPPNMNSMTGRCVKSDLDVLMAQIKLNQEKEDRERMDLLQALKGEDYLED